MICMQFPVYYYIRSFYIDLRGKKGKKIILDCGAQFPQYPLTLLHPPVMEMEKMVKFSRTKRYFILHNRNIEITSHFTIAIFNITTKNRKFKIMSFSRLDVGMCNLMKIFSSTAELGGW